MAPPPAVWQAKGADVGLNGPVGEVELATPIQ